MRKSLKDLGWVERGDRDNHHQRKMRLNKEARTGLGMERKMNLKGIRKPGSGSVSLSCGQKTQCTESLQTQ